MLVSASRGKVLRAEPVSALYEQGLVHHVGRFAVLEDQLCAFTTAGYRGEGSPDHADALVFAITELMLNEPAAIIEFYRRQGADRASRTGKDWRSVPTRHRSGCVRPRGFRVHMASLGRSTSSVMTASSSVKPEDSAALIAAGFESVPKQQT